MNGAGVSQLFWMLWRHLAGIEVAEKKGIYKGRKKGAIKGETDRTRELWEKGLKVSDTSPQSGKMSLAVWIADHWADGALRRLVVGSACVSPLFLAKGPESTTACDRVQQVIAPQSLEVLGSREVSNNWNNLILQYSTNHLGVPPPTVRFLAGRKPQNSRQLVDSTVFLNCIS